jgi:diguanylate cyclase (GGDEF)-like protein
VVNDSFGHGTGDRVLVDLGRRLRDEVGWRGTVGRFGGDEYVVVVVVDAVEDAVVMAEQLGRLAQEPFVVAGPDQEQAEVFLSCSVGIALGEEGDDPSTLLHHADAAMYRSKARGPGAWELYDEGMRHAARARLTLESDLARALEEDAFDLHYRPIMAVGAGRTTAVEALARWTHPRRGPVPPAEFIPVLEETGGIHALGRWALHAACRQLRDWRTAGFGSVGISVNLSPQQLGHDDLATEVEDVVEAHGIDPAQLTFEITETFLMRDLDAAVKALSRLRDVGCRLALDDFGTGWSSLTYLRSVPVDSVKIDRSFIEGVADSPEDRAIVGSVVWLCRTLGKDVVAEGVETEEQYEALVRLGCTHAQGFLLAPPQPAAELTGWLRRTT